MARKFENLNPAPLFGAFTDPFGDRRGTGPIRPAQPVDAAQPDFLHPFAPEKLYFSWLGHASVFLHIGGKNILLDPIFSKRPSPVPFIGPKRFPGRTVTPAELPYIDLILITHNHYDHLDRKTLQSLAGQTGHYLVPLGVGKLLRRFGIAGEKITEMGWYDSWEHNGLQISLTPTQHNSARSLWDSGKTLWGSYWITDGKYTVFDSGDGGFGSHFSDIHSRFGCTDLYIAECGQYGEKWHGLHMFPEESVESCRVLGAGLSVPVHWGGYILSDHPWDDPPKRFARRADELGVPYRIPKRNELLVLEK